MSDPDELPYQQYYNQLLVDELQKHKTKQGKLKLTLTPIKIEFDQEQYSSFREAASTKRQKQVLCEGLFMSVMQQRQLISLQNNEILQRTRSNRNINIRNIKKDRPKILQLLITNPQQKIEHLRKELKAMRRDNQIFLKNQDSNVQQKIKRKIKGIDQTPKKLCKIASINELHTISEHQCSAKSQKYSHERELKIIKEGLSVKRCRPLIYSPASMTIQDDTNNMATQRGDIHCDAGKNPKFKVKQKRKCFTVERQSPTHDQDMSMKLFLVGRLNPLKNVLEYVKTIEKTKNRSKNYTEVRQKGNQSKFLEGSQKRSSNTLEQLANSNEFRCSKKSSGSLFEKLLMNRRSSVKSNFSDSSPSQKIQLRQKATIYNKVEECISKRVQEGSTQQPIAESKYSQKSLSKIRRQKHKKIILSFKTKTIDREYQNQNSLIENQLSHPTHQQTHI